jgi:hypothetical protein
MCCSQKGVSLIAAVFIIVILAFMGLMFLSMVNTASITAVNDIQSTRALYIAEGGVEYGKMALAPYSSWYNFANDPYSLATNQTLGNGSFTTTINVPATTVRKSFGVNATVIRVFSVDLFPPGGGSIGVGGSGDIRTYTNTATGGALGNRFEGVSTPGPSAYAAGTYIYPVLTLSAAISATDTIIPFAGNGSKFLQKGTITIDDPVNGDEEITCAGIQTSPTAAFTGCNRDATAVAHAAGLNILPILTKQEVLIQGDGVVGNARRVITDVTDQ